MSATTRGLHARTVPLEYGPDALQFDGSPTALFDRPGLTLVGWGTAQLVPADEADARAAGHPVRRPGRRSGVGRGRARRAPLYRRDVRSLGHPALHDGHRERCRGRHTALGHGRRAGGRGTPEHRGAVRCRHLAVRRRARGGRLRGARQRQGRDQRARQRRLPRRGRPRRRCDASARRHLAQGGPLPPAHRRALGPPRAHAGAAPAARRRTHLRGLRHAHARRHVLRRVPRAPRGAQRFPRDLPPTGGHRPTGHHRPYRRRCPRPAGRLGQGPCRAPLRRRRHRRRAGTLLRGADGPPDALTGHVPLGGAPRDAHRRPPQGAVADDPPAPRSPPSDTRRRRDAPKRRARRNCSRRAERPGLLGGARRLDRRARATASG